MVVIKKGELESFTRNELDMASTKVKVNLEIIANSIFEWKL